jgi:hypothetical protein
MFAIWPVIFPKCAASSVASQKLWNGFVAAIIRENAEKLVRWNKIYTSSEKWHFLGEMFGHS